MVITTQIWGLFGIINLSLTQLLSYRNYISKGIIAPIDLTIANGEPMTKESIALNFNIHIDLLSCYRMISSLRNTCLTMQQH